MDRVLNLSAFGEILKKGDTLKKSGNDTSREDPNKYGHIFKMLLQNTAQAKLYHWQSGLYGQHKALDELFKEIIDLGDELAESLMGKYGRPVLSEDNLTLELENFKDPEKGELSPFLDKLYKCYSVDCRSVLDEEADSELLNIIDEITATINQVKYLTSLR